LGGEDSVVALVFGGTQEPAWNLVKKNFEAKYPGVKVQLVIGGSVEHLAKARAQKSNPQVDVLGGNDLVDFTASREGLVTSLDPDAVTNMQKIYPEAKLDTKNGVAFSYQAIGIAYNEKVFQEKGWAPPSSWKDLADSKYKGHVYGTDCSFSYTLYSEPLLAEAWGGSPNDLTAMKAGWKAIAANRPTLSSSATTIENAMTSGDAWLVAWFSTARTNALRQKGAPFKFVYPKEGAAAFPNALDVVKGAPHPKAAQAFINEALALEPQQKFATLALFGPARSDAWDALPSDIQQLVPGPQEISGAEAKAKKVDIKDISEHTNERVTACEDVFSG
jgi:putative spermidine/putrescine transport system substrate-binding protein